MGNEKRIGLGAHDRRGNGTTVERLQAMNSIMSSLGIPCEVCGNGKDARLVFPDGGVRPTWQDARPDGSDVRAFSLSGSLIDTMYDRVVDRYFIEGSSIDFSAEIDADDLIRDRHRFDRFSDHWVFSALVIRPKNARVGPICEWLSDETDDYVELHAFEDNRLALFSSMELP